MHPSHPPHLWIVVVWDHAVSCKLSNMNLALPLRLVMLPPCSYDFAFNSFIKEGGLFSLIFTFIYYSCMYLCSFQQQAAAAATLQSTTAASSSRQLVDGDKGRKRLPQVAWDFKCASFGAHVDCQILGHTWKWGSCFDKLLHRATALNGLFL